MKNVRLLYLIIVISCCAIMSCNKTSSQKSSTESSPYELVIVDSLIINSLEELQIMDYSSSKDRFLAYGTTSKNCMEIDRNGNILNRVDLSGQGPGHFGAAMVELGYFDDGFIIKAPGVYNVFDSEWNYLYKIPYEAAGYTVPLKYIYERPEVAVIDEVSVIVEPNDESFGGFLKLEQDYFKNTNLVNVYKESATEKEGILKYPESSIYQNTSVYYANHSARIAFNESKDILYAALPYENVVYQFQLSPEARLLKADTLALTQFKAPQGVPFEDQHKNPLAGFGPSNKLNYVYAMTNSSILNLQSKGETLMVNYKTGTEGQANFLDHTAASEVVRQESKNITAFFRDGEKLFETSKQLPRNVLMNESQCIVPYVNEAVEMDYNVYYIYELKKRQ